MEEETKTSDALISAVSTVVVQTLEEKKTELIAKLEAQIASTSSFGVKLRNKCYIALLETASDAITEKLIEKLA